MTSPTVPLRMIAFAAVLSFAATSDAAQSESQNSAAAAAEMMIEGGRLGVMLDQVDAAMKLGGEPSEEPVETPTQQQVYVLHELRAAVLRYNVMQFAACRASMVAGEVCAQPYLPHWLEEPADSLPAPATLAARVQDAVNHIMPFWKAMCARAVAQTHDDTFCAME